jgi:hypothetical protein
VLQVRTTRAASSAGLGRQALAQPAFRPAARGKLPGRASQAVGRFEARHCAAIFIVFLIILNSRNYFKLPKFIETCRNVYNLQNKFCMNHLELLFPVGLTKLTFMR